MFFLKKSRIAIVALGIATAGAARAQMYINDLSDFYLGGFQTGYAYDGVNNDGWLPVAAQGTFGTVDTSGTIAPNINSFDFSQYGSIYQTVNVSTGGTYQFAYLEGIALYQSVVDPTAPDFVTFSYINSSNQTVNLSQSTTPSAYMELTSNGPQTNGDEFTNLYVASLADVAANSAITITVTSNKLLGDQTGSNGIGNYYFSAPPTTVIGPGTTPEPFTMALGIAGAGLAVKRARKKKQIA